MERMNIKAKMAMLEELEVMFDQLECDEKSTKQYSGRTEQQVQLKHWNRETHDYDLEYDENGDPVMEYV